MRAKEHTKETKSKKFNYMNPSWQYSGDNLSQDHKIAFVQDAKIQKESSLILTDCSKANFFIFPLIKL